VRVGARFRRVYIWGILFLENPKSMSEGPLFLGWFVKFLFHFAFLEVGGSRISLGLGWVEGFVVRVREGVG